MSDCPPGCRVNFNIVLDKNIVTCVKFVYEIHAYHIDD